MGHLDDHIHIQDEIFQYRGRLPQALVEDWFRDEKKKFRILNLQGFIACGKTRTSKEFARLLAQQLREKDGQPSEVHTFWFDLRKKSRESLLKSIHRDFTDKIWKSHEDIKSVDELINAFKKERDRAYIIVLDNVDRVDDKQQPDIQEFVEKLVSGTDNVYLVLTTRMKLKFVRIRTKVLDKCMKPMEPGDAKELLKETSGNPQGLDAYADDIIKLVCRSPLALIIAGHEMNEMYTMLPYTPQEFVGVMKDSTSLSIDLENVPTEDRIINRVAEIVETNFNVLEKIVVALDCPQLSNAEDLEHAVAAISGPPEYEGQIKQTILHVVLRRSLYGMSEETNGKVSLESAPFLIEVLKETFCQMTSKDEFLKEVNMKLVKTLSDTRPLMRSIAKELRQTEIHLLRNQKHQEVTSQEKRELQRNVISAACAFLTKVEVQAGHIKDFKACCSKILNELEKVESGIELMSGGQGGIQETCRDQLKQPTACSGDHQNVSSRGKEKEKEARLFPTCPSDIAFPGLKEINKTNAIAKSPVTEVHEVNVGDGNSDESSKVDITNPQKGSDAELEPSGCEKKKSVNENLSDSTVNTTLLVEPGVPELMQNVEIAVSKESSRPDVDVNLQSPLKNCAISVPCNLINDENTIIPHLQSLSVSVLSLPGSLHSNDCRKPNEESLPSGATYSALPTLPDNHVLPGSSNPANSRREGAQPVNGSSTPTPMQTKEAVESEFDWEHGDSNDGNESLEATNAVQKPCDAVTHAEGDEDRPEDKTEHVLQESKPNQLPQVSTTTTVTVTTTMDTRNQSEAGSHPSLQESHPNVQRYDTRGRGILGTAPSSSSSASPAYSQRRFTSHCNPVPHQNIPIQPADRGFPSHRGYVNGNLRGQEHRQMISPSPLQPPYGEGGTYFDHAYRGDSFQSNQFGQEFNQVHYPSSHNSYPSNNAIHQDFTNNSHMNLQARGSPVQSYVSTPSPSFQAQGPSYGFPQVQKHSLQSQMSSSGFRAQASSHAHGPPFQSNDLSQPPNFHPQGPPFFSPSHSLRTNGYRVPSTYSNDSSVSPSFRPQGPPALSLPRSLRTNEFGPSSGYSNGTHGPSSQRGYSQQYQQQPGYRPQRNARY